LGLKHPVLHAEAESTNCPALGPDRSDSGRSQRGKKRPRMPKQGMPGSSWRDLRILGRAALQSPKTRGRPQAAVDAQADVPGIGCFPNGAVRTVPASRAVVSRHDVVNWTVGNGGCCRPGQSEEWREGLTVIEGHVASGKRSPAPSVGLQDAREGRRDGLGMAENSATTSFCRPVWRNRRSKTAKDGLFAGGPG
jgi:hypothetical protein